jgi:glycosyltransferase involved in cell wall biosynthesis
MSNPRISVIIPTFNSGKYLENCVASVAAAAQHYGNAELILMDNGSTDGSYEKMQQLFAGQARIFQVPKVRIGALRNRGAQVAQGEFLSFIDSDCLVPADYLHRAMAVFQNMEADAAGCEYALPESPVWMEETWHYLHWPTEDGYRPHRYSSGNFVVRREVFEKIGGFDETLITGEDAEIGLRLTAAGYRVFRAADLIAYHMGNPKTIGVFFRKEIWHGLGMLGSLKTDPFDKPLMMTFLHLLLTVAGIVGAVLIPAIWLVRLAVLTLPSFVAPFLTALYRGYQRGRLYRPVTSTLLYHLYYDARICALFKVLLGRA